MLRAPDGLRLILSSIEWVLSHNKVLVWSFTKEKSTRECMLKKGQNWLYMLKEQALKWVHFLTFK